MTLGGELIVLLATLSMFGKPKVHVWRSCACVAKMSLILNELI